MNKFLFTHFVSQKNNKIEKIKRYLLIFIAIKVQVIHFTTIDNNSLKQFKFF